jgi:hypothetical protein
LATGIGCSTPTICDELYASSSLLYDGRAYVGALRLKAADPEFEGKVQAAEAYNRQYANAIRALVRRSI